MQITSTVPRTYTREWGNRIDWDSKVVGLRGARGVGKTTLLLQKYWQLYADPNKCLYVLGDDIAVASKGLFDVVKYFFDRGGEAVIIDEVHRYPQWQKHVKTLIDVYKNKTFWLSGSSSLCLKNQGADLSRRVPWYDLPGLSFREFLALKNKTNIHIYSIEQILNNSTKISSKLTSQAAILSLFEEYLLYGYYPFFLEGIPTFGLKMRGIIDKVLSEDIPSFYKISADTIVILKKILDIVATSKAFQPNMDKLSKDLKISRVSVYNFIKYLEQAHFFYLLYSQSTGIKRARKPEKIYFSNTNLLQSIAEKELFVTDKGALRETFFISQLTATNNKIAMGSNVDFVLNDDTLIEIGGRNKNKKQLQLESTKNIKRKILVQDDISIGSNDTIPLYLFGLLY
jgi:predicted AAA+ superfamily ATPase